MPQSVTVAKTSLLTIAAISLIVAFAYATTVTVSLIYGLIAVGAAAVALALRPGSRAVWWLAVIFTELTIVFVVMLGLLMLAQRETEQPTTVTITAALFALSVCASTALMAPRARNYLRLADQQG